jgi:hypothetical protein
MDRDIREYLEECEYPLPHCVEDEYDWLGDIALANGSRFVGYLDLALRYHDYIRSEVADRVVVRDPLIGLTSHRTPGLWNYLARACDGECWELGRILDKTNTHTEQFIRWAVRVKLPLPLFMVIESQGKVWNHFSDEWHSIAYTVMEQYHVIHSDVILSKMWRSDWVGDVIDAIRYPESEFLFRIIGTRDAPYGIPFTEFGAVDESQITDLIRYSGVVGYRGSYHDTMVAYYIQHYNLDKVPETQVEDTINFISGSVDRARLLRSAVADIGFKCNPVYTVACWVIPDLAECSPADPEVKVVGCLSSRNVRNLRDWVGVVGWRGSYQLTKQAYRIRDLTNRLPGVPQVEFEDLSDSQVLSLESALKQVEWAGSYRSTMRSQFVRCMVSSGLVGLAESTIAVLAAAPGIDIEDVKTDILLLQKMEVDAPQLYGPVYITDRSWNSVATELLGSYKRGIPGRSDNAKRLFSELRKTGWSPGSDRIPMSAIELLIADPAFTSEVVKVEMISHLDPRAYIVGNYTDCCMSSNSQYITDYLESEYRFLVVSRQLGCGEWRIVAQSVIPHVIGDGVVLDNIEIAKHVTSECRVLIAKAYLYFVETYTVDNHLVPVYQGMGYNDLVLPGKKGEGPALVSQYNYSDYDSGHCIVVDVNHQSDDDVYWDLDGDI